MSRITINVGVPKEDISPRHVKTLEAIAAGVFWSEEYDTAATDLEQAIEQESGELYSLAASQKATTGAERWNS